MKAQNLATGGSVQRCIIFTSLFRRPHKPNLGEVKSIRRLVWEVIHKNLGRFTLVFAIVQISLGVFLAVAHTGVWATWFGYVCFLVLAYIVAEINKRCKDMSNYETKGTMNSANSAKRYILRSPHYGISIKDPNCYDNAAALESEG